MKNLSIKIKLILLFIIIKVVPLLLISYIAFIGIIKLDKYFSSSTKELFLENKQIISNTANKAISDSIEMLDKKSQQSIERLSFEIAKNVASFLYQRDEDILFLSKIKLDQKVLSDFYKSKQREIIVHGEYYYDEKSKRWESSKRIKSIKRQQRKAQLKDNEKEFNYTDPKELKRVKIPIYKEVSYFDINGKEIYKISQINKQLLDISKKKNTYVNSEEYFKKIEELKKGQIYVSDVIGQSVKTNIIGTFTKKKAKEANIEFEPQNHGYAGKENPKGKKFEGIIRFVTPVYKKDKKVGYVSLALDHEHIMQFTDTVNPVDKNPIQDIADASVGNYAFMWDYEGKNISHPRDYSIVGYDPKTGKQAMPWLSEDVAKKYYASKKDINEFLKDYPKFEEQSLNKKPNMKQLIKDGNVNIDCRYLNFAPQCQGWMQLTQNGGYGSFIIHWSNIWKLSTAAAIPYYTGKYANSKRGFGFVSITANVDEFHAAANKTKEKINVILDSQTKNMNKSLEKNRNEIEKLIMQMLNDITISTVVMIVLVMIIALLMSSYISKKIENILLGTRKFSNNEFNYRLKITSNDEIGQLENSFNEMANKIETLVKTQNDLNKSLEQKVEEEIEKQRKQEQLLIQQSKLAAMGEMIGNIAHQWRQPLNALGLVMQNMQFAYSMGDLDDKFMERSIKKTNILTSSMSKTIDDFRNFFKPNKTKEYFEINKTVKKAIYLIESTFEHSYIEIEKEFSKEDIEVYGYTNEFSQSILNILSNAKDALIEKKVEDAKVKIRVYKDKNSAIVQIEDNAKGISEDIKDKIFEPYFTTKEEGKGTGIGLYMTKTIIENSMGGAIIVENINLGACFTICVPLLIKEKI
ncbi:two-component system sensor histidine kinase [Malaciobacter marinus]|uniref:histidine kinase n=4 Tax=Malaciobacter marinus TaxID=505249 RepID=A0A347TID2_9BACT|nr:HAMP domain-containing sensor histidine kinase [Malaciobacter marinus]AXX86360.1 two-component system sensor histidine kinase [Malaciobacter marinus]